MFLSEGAKAGATYIPKVDVCHCESNECHTLNVAIPASVAHLQQHEDDYAGQCNEVTPSVTPIPSVEPSVSPEPTVTETPTATPSPTNTPENKQDVSDGRSDGRSDGLCSKPPCVDNRSGVPLYKETINK